MNIYYYLILTILCVCNHSCISISTLYLDKNKTIIIKLIKTNNLISSEKFLSIHNNLII